MKNKKTLRILGIALVLSLLIALVPATPAMGAVAITLTPTQGKVAAVIQFSVTGYTASGDTSYYCDLYISDQQAIANNMIDTAVTRYFKLKEVVEIDSLGIASGTFIVPATLNQGALGTTNAVTLTPGVTYYVYATGRYAAMPYSKSIAAVTTFTVTQSGTLNALVPTSGPAGTDVQVSGTNFPTSAQLVFKLDNTITLTPKAGDSTTNTAGTFTTTVTIPADAAVSAHTINVAAGSVALSATFTVSPNPSLTINPATGEAGTLVLITGTAFPAGSSLGITFDTAPIIPTSGSSATDASGSFNSYITIPATVTAGAHTISITAGSTTRTATFTAAAPATTPPATTPPETTPPATTPPATTTPPANTPSTLPATPSVNPATSVQMGSTVDTIGGAVTVIGMSFTPNAQVMFKFDDASMAVVNANGDGLAVASFLIPPAKHGAHTIWAADMAGNWDSVVFNVESIGPATPQPLKPGMFAKVKSPIVFDWADVTDPSLPVTYELQISTDANFASDKIVVNKTGLATSEYTLTDDEAAELTGPDVTYYWRERALDGAQNPSEWTGAAQFTVTPPFKFTGWPMYVTIAIGAVLVFLLGLFVGRRTAFYY